MYWFTLPIASTKTVILKRIFRILFVILKEWVNISVSVSKIKPEMQSQRCPNSDLKTDIQLQKSLSFQTFDPSRPTFLAIFHPSFIKLKIKYLIFFIAQERSHNISCKCHWTFIATLKLTMDHSSWLPKFTIGFLTSFEPSICSV